MKTNFKGVRSAAALVLALFVSNVTVAQTLPYAGTSNASGNTFSITNTSTNGSTAAIIGVKQGNPGYGVIGTGTSSIGVYGESLTSYGVSSFCGPIVYDATNYCIASYNATGSHLPNARAVYGGSGQGTGVWAETDTGVAIRAKGGSSGAAISASSILGTAVVVSATNAVGISISSSQYALDATATGVQPAIRATGGVTASSSTQPALNATGGAPYTGAISAVGPYFGVVATGTANAGFSGSSSSSNGVEGKSSNAGASGVYGENQFNGYGIAGRSNSAGVAILGDNATGTAGQFNGNVHVYGALFATWKYFEIDHPQDPEGKVLRHISMESPEAKTFYDGVAVLGPNGTAVVDLPTYFGALNSDVRYQLTCIGGYAPVYVSKEVSGNSFEVAGGPAGMKVSWQVTGIRKDPAAIASRLPVEAPKAPQDRGRYLSPAAFGPGAQPVFGAPAAPVPARAPTQTP